MREYQTTVVVDEAGELQFQLKTDLEPGQHHLTVLTADQLEMLRIRLSLGVFLEDWDDPAMAIYDTL